MLTLEEIVDELQQRLNDARDYAEKLKASLDPTDRDDECLCWNECRCPSGKRFDDRMFYADNPLPWNDNPCGICGDKYKNHFTSEHEFVDALG